MALPPSVSVSRRRPRASRVSHSAIPAKTVGGGRQSGAQGLKQQVFGE